MRRRALLLFGGAVLLTGASTTRSFAQKSRPLIAVLMPGTQSAYRSRLEAFRAELKNLGYIEGRDVQLETRWGEDRTERLEGLAAELVALRPAVILTASSAAVAACQKATRTIPIIFATGSTPVELGFVKSFAQPGGNVTGVVIHGMEGKLVELAREALPQARRLAVLVHEPDPMHKPLLETFLAACAKFRFEPVVGRIKRVEELGLVFNEVLGRKPDALILPNLVFMFSNDRYIVERALEARLPLLTGRVETTAAGGLMSYGSSRNENFRRTAHMVDKILRGAKPSELPVEQPDRLELVVNTKTLKALGIELPPSTMVRARVVQ